MYLCIVIIVVAKRSSTLETLTFLVHTNDLPNGNGNGIIQQPQIEQLKASNLSIMRFATPTNSPGETTGQAFTQSQIGGAVDVSSESKDIVSVSFRDVCEDV